MGMLLKACDILHRRCKGTPGLVRAFINDPTSLVALLKVLAGRIPGSYFSVSESLPVRALILPMRRLTGTEKLMFYTRVAEIVRLYAAKRMNRATDCSDLYPLRSLRRCQPEHMKEIFQHFHTESQLESKQRNSN